MKRKLIIPEVIQASAMDCGPASLKAILEGFDIPISYGRLREACQTSVDGTSIDTLEEVAIQLGLEAEQIVLPSDHFFLPEAKALPALVVVRLPHGVTHFVVVWGCCGPLVQVMDPARGRLWMGYSQFLKEVYIHRLPIPASQWREWAGSEQFLSSLKRLWLKIGISDQAGETLLQQALSDPGWYSLAALEAAIRMVISLINSRGLSKGQKAAQVLKTFLLESYASKDLPQPSQPPQASQAFQSPQASPIPQLYWSVRPGPSPAAVDVDHEDDEDDEKGEDNDEEEGKEEEYLIFQGMVLVRIMGRASPSPVRDTPVKDRPVKDATYSAKDTITKDTMAKDGCVNDSISFANDAPCQEIKPPLPLELEAALREPPLKPGQEIIKFLRADGVLAPVVLVAAFFFTSLGFIIETLLLQGLFEISQDLHLVEQRLGALAVLLILVIALLLLELPIGSCLLSLGRHLEARLRLAFLTKLPKLKERYFQSRLNSDMAERSHSVHWLRSLPDLGGQLIRSMIEFLITAIAIVWLFPESLFIVLAGSLLLIIVPMFGQLLLTEKDLRSRSYLGSLSRFYLDTLIGLVPIQAHAAQRPIRREHEGLVTEWSRAKLGHLSAVIMVETAQVFIGFGLAFWLLLAYYYQGGLESGVLLLVYWGLHLATLGQEIAQIARQYPTHRNITLRLLEPLGAPEEEFDQALPTADLAIKSANHQTLAHKFSALTPPDTEAPVRPLADHPALSYDFSTQMTSDTKAPAMSLADHQALAYDFSAGVSVVMDKVSLTICGHSILEEINLAIPAGMHLAIIGASGAGKSSLAGLLLNWHQPSLGRILINGQPLTPQIEEALHQITAWLDPATQLWNRSMVNNLYYGLKSESARPAGLVIEEAQLMEVLEKLPLGLGTLLGEGGGLVSGGEGQRVRFGRAMAKEEVKLVILDEPFRGLDPTGRSQLLEKARSLWKKATLVCITHDIGATRSFDRVVVIEQGSIVEEGDPKTLIEDPNSFYRKYLDLEKRVSADLWSGSFWRRITLEKGRIKEG